MRLSPQLFTFTLSVRSRRRHGICNFIAYLKTLAMEGPEPRLSPGEIRLLRLLLSRSLEFQHATGIILGPGEQRTDVSGGASTFAPGGLFFKCGQPLPERKPTLPTPVFDAIVGNHFCVCLHHLVVSLATGAIHFGPPLAHCARRILRTLIRRLRRYFGFRQE